MTANRFIPSEALRRLPDPQGARFVEVFQHGTLRIEMYAPRGIDPQLPHTQDEIYVVLQGHGWFINDGDRHPFSPGDVLFVPAGVEHRFIDFSDDLAVWVIFYGPQGGEIPAGSSERSGED